MASATTSGLITLWKVNLSESKPKFEFQYTSACHNQLIIHKLFLDKSGKRCFDLVSSNNSFHLVENELPKVLAVNEKKDFFQIEGLKSRGPFQKRAKILSGIKVCY